MVGPAEAEQIADVQDPAQEASPAGGRADYLCRGTRRAAVCRRTGLRGVVRGNDFATRFPTPSPRRSLSGRAVGRGVIERIVSQQPLP